jgi:hypoxanthine phosphoribosyltransferase
MHQPIAVTSRDAPDCVISAPRPGARKLRILVVDDHRDTADSLACVLHVSAVSKSHAKSVSAAVRKARCSSP